MQRGVRRWGVDVRAVHSDFIHDQLTTYYVAALYMIALL
jgi:hypothetical protein